MPQGRRRSQCEHALGFLGKVGDVERRCAGYLSTAAGLFRCRGRFGSFAVVVSSRRPAQRRHADGDGGQANTGDEPT